jgi:carbon-monoxide dehydrogenase medium subunit|nr:MAG: carbon monoxide dehydrogenase [Pseudomonadota bacterium]
MYAFDYQRPSTVSEAATLLADGSGAKLLAGGQTLIPTMKQRLASPPLVVDLRDVAELKGIERTEDRLVIGAMTTHAQVAESSVVAAAISGLCKVAESIGDPHVRNRGTLGGSLANNDPAADYPAAVLALDATVHTNKREIAADDFFQGLFTTALEEDEIITRVSFPIPERFAYAKFPNPASRYAMVGVAVAKGPQGVRVAVTGAGQNGVFRATDMEAALANSFTPDALKGITVDPSLMNSDIHADAAYRAHLVTVMARRAVEAAAA